MMILSSIEKRILEVLEPISKALGIEIVKIKFSGSNRKVLDIAIDKIDGNSVTIKDCREASNNFSAILDVEDIINDKYYLEVGSAGVERPLIKIEDFSRFKGREVVIKLHKPYGESKKFQCKIIGVKDEKVELSLKNNEIVEFEYSNIKGANLVFTDEMFRQSLAKQEIKE